MRIPASLFRRVPHLDSNRGKHATCYTPAAYEPLPSAYPPPAAYELLPSAYAPLTALRITQLHCGSLNRIPRVRRSILHPPRQRGVNTLRGGQAGRHWLCNHMRNRACGSAEVAVLPRCHRPCLHHPHPPPTSDRAASGLPGPAHPCALNPLFIDVEEFSVTTADGTQAWIVRI